MSYPKLNDNKHCAYPNRKDCNYDMKADDPDKRKYERCKYMKYNNDASPFSDKRWICTYKP